MITIAAKARISFVSHGLWRAALIHTKDTFTSITCLTTAMGHSPEGAYANLKHHMERAGYLLVAPQHEVKAKAVILDTATRVLRRTIEAHSGPSPQREAERLVARLQLQRLQYEADQHAMNVRANAYLGHVRLRDGTEPSELRGHP